MDFKIKEKYDIYDLVDLVKALRAPDGCPWDKVQTHETIRKDLLEEVYETVEAIDDKDTEHLREELGDVLFQVVFHSVIESELDHFGLDEVIDDVGKKMVLRHPHVFGNVNAETTEDVWKNWDKIKMQTHSQSTIGETMDGISSTLPALMKAQKLRKKAKRGGVGPMTEEEVCCEIGECLENIKQAAKTGDKVEQSKALGRFLFAAVGLTDIVDVDCEMSLYDACNEYRARFDAYEQKALEEGVDIQGSDTEVTNRLWKAITKKENLEEN